MADKKPATNKGKVSAARADAAKARKEAIKAKAQLARERAAKVAETPIGGFVNFIREKGVVGLAVGLAIGSAATALVAQIVASLITPFVGLIVGEKGLDGLNFTAKVADRSEVFAIGDLIDALIKFIALAAVIYFVIMGLKLDRLDKKKEDK